MRTLLPLLAFVIGVNTIPVVFHNDRPVIGVVSEPIEQPVPGKTSYIAASYVKWLESAGARVVPLRFDASREELAGTLQGINAVLFPGGGASLAPNSTFFLSAQFIWEHAIRSNENGEHFPVWGTCLGFELIGVLGAQNHSVIQHGFDSEDYAIPLKLTEGVEHTSRLFSFIGKESSWMLNSLATEDITMNMHSHGIPPAAFQDIPTYGAFFDNLATNKDRKGRVFTSVVEGKKYPVFGTQFHPEKNNFEWKAAYPIPHTAHAVMASQVFANFFVSEARRSDRTTPATDLNKKLIYNFNPVYSGGIGGYFEQTYFF